MMRNRANYIFFHLLLVCISTGKGQDIHFSQFYESPLLLNPAAAGASDADYRFALNYKNQWKSVINPFKTAALSFDTKLLNKPESKNHFGAGISMFNDKVGAAKFTTNQVNIDLADHFTLNTRSRISAGIKAGLFQKYINANGLKWDNQYNGRDYDASRPSGESITINNYNSMDLGAGLLYTYTKVENALQIQGGFSATHLNSPKNSFYSKDESTKMKLTAHANASFQPKDKNYRILPAFIMAKQGGHTEIVAGSNIALLMKEQNRFSSAIHFGVFYRVKDAAIFVAALEYKKNMKFGISYDVNLSRLTTASKFRGGPEFSFIYTGIRKIKKKPEPLIDTIVNVAPPEKAVLGVFTGKVTGENDQPIVAEISITPIDPENKLGEKAERYSKNIQSDPDAKNYKLELDPGLVYKIKVKSEGYETLEAEIDLINLNKFTESEKDFHLTLKKPEPKPEGPCGGKPMPDFSIIKGKSLNDQATYNTMLSIFERSCEEGLIFKIQIAAYPEKRANEYNYQRLKQYGEPEMITYADGLTRFTQGNFNSIKEAEELRQKIIASGQKDAWLVLFINNKRIPLEEYISR